MKNKKMGYGKGSNTFTHQFTASATGTYLIKVYRTGNQSNGSFYIDDALITHEEEVTQTLCEDFAGYRYGFNGMEKDNEIKGAGNSYDFGSRIYDPRLGRWLAVDPQRHLYPGFAPYSSFAGNPLFFLDADGEILTDSEGNPIYVNAGIVDLKAGESYYDPKTNSYVYPVIKAQRRIYFTNEGNPIYAYDHLELGEITATKVKSNMDPRNIDVLEPEATTITYRRTGDVPNDLKYDCHGYTIIKRKSPGIKLWIGSREDNTGYDNITPVLNDDGWVNIGSDINKAKAGDLAVFRDKDGISHTAIYNGDGTFTTKDGSKKFSKNESLESEKSQWGEDVTYYRGGSDKKVSEFDEKGVKGSGGRRLKNKREVKRIIKQMQKKEAKKTE